MEDKLEVTIYWNYIKDADMKRIREKFGMSNGMSVNRETIAYICAEDWELLKEVERLGYIQVRIK